MTAAECTAKIDKMAELTDGWDSYGAKAPNEVARTNAGLFCIAACAAGLEPDRVVPSSAAAVGVYFGQDDDDREVWVEFYNRGTVVAAFTEDSSDDVRTVSVLPGEYGFQRLIEETKHWLE